MTIFLLANLRKKRVNFRATTNLFTFFGMIARSQKLEGVTTQVFDDKGKPTKNHYVFFDLEGTTLKIIKKILKRIQQKYGLSNIFITSDNNKTFRGWCFSIVSFDTLLKILIDCKEIVDFGFVQYTFKRKEATLRLSQKEGRPLQNIVAVIESFSVPFPKVMKHVVYVTGCEKKGSTIDIGVK